MESSACRRGASDADQSARAYSATVKCEPVMVKEEPEWGECGVSEAAVAEGLYADHEIKDELVIGPQLVQKQHIALSMHDVPAINERQPEPKPAGGAGAKPGCSNTCAGHGSCCNRSTEQEYGNKRYLVKLQRLPVGNHHRSKLNPNLVLPELKPVHYGMGKSRAGEVFTGCQPPPNENLSTSQTYLPKQVLTNTNKEPERSKISFIPISQLSTICISEKPYSCDVCNRRFAHKRSMALHVKAHTGERPFSCDVCNKRFKQKVHLTRHLRTHTGEKPFSCDVCNKRFAEKTNLTLHVRRHTGEKPYRSDVFNKRTHYLTLAHHLRTSTDVLAINECQPELKPAGGAGAKPGCSNSCPGDGPRCNKSTEQQHGAKRYLVKLKRLPVRDQHGRTPFYVSHDCKLNPSLVSPELKPVHNGVGKSRAGEVFTSCQPPPNDNLSRSHTYLPKRVLTNTNTEPKENKISFIQISQQSDLTRPILTDTPEAEFKKMTDLRTHVRVHLSDKLNSCIVCKKRFKFKSQLTEHIQTHTGEKLYSCDVCNRQFGRKSNLIRHLRTQHNTTHKDNINIC